MTGPTQLFIFISLLPGKKLVTELVTEFDAPEGVLQYQTSLLVSDHWQAKATTSMPHLIFAMEDSLMAFP